MLNEKTIKELKKSYYEHEINKDSKIEKQNQSSYCDYDGVMAFIPKTHNTLQSFSKIFKCEGLPHQVNYTNKAVTVSFSLEYLKDVLKILSTVDSDLTKTCNVTLQNEAPISFEIKEFKLQLANKVTIVGEDL